MLCVTLRAMKAMLETAPYAGIAAPKGSAMMVLSALSPPPYGRGAGYVIWQGKKCSREHPDLGCEKWGALWYPKCKENYHN